MGAARSWDDYWRTIAENIKKHKGEESQTPFLDSIDPSNLTSNIKELKHIIDRLVSEYEEVWEERITPDMVKEGMEEIKEKLSFFEGEYLDFIDAQVEDPETKKELEDRLKTEVKDLEDIITEQNDWIVYLQE